MMNIEWLFDDTDADYAMMEVKDLIDSDDYDQRIADGFEALCMN